MVNSMDAQRIHGVEVLAESDRLSVIFYTSNVRQS